jgi:hypothetical protein
MLNTVQEIVSKKKSISNANVKDIMAFAATLKEKKAQALEETPEKTVEEAPEQPEAQKTEEEAPKDTSETTETPKDPVDKTEADHDWKKRYADLKRFVDTDLKKQLDEATKKAKEAEKALKEGQTKYAKPEQLAQFEEEYGDLAPIVKELAFKEADKLFQEYLEREEAKREAENAEKTKKTQYLTEAQKLVAEKHPDWQEVGKSKVFQTWLGKQSSVTQRLASDSDPESVILVLDMYKKDTGYAAKKAAEAKQLKSEAVKVKEEPVTPSAPEVIDVNALKKAIVKAQSKGDMKELGRLLAKFDKLKKGK